MMRDKYEVQNYHVMLMIKQKSVISYMGYICLQDGFRKSTLDTAFWVIQPELHRA